ncbi:MAG: ATP synthase F1 subunit epsilon [Clostridiales bacterium]|nr:ATP synthase F1 subunit epsilon [Clostridiales bacterium]
MISSLTAPATLGSLGVLPNHAPLLTTLETGLLNYKKSGQEVSVIALDTGLMEVNDNHVLVLVQAAEKAQEIDLPRAEASLARAKERLASPAKDIDLPRAEASLKRALNRIKASPASPQGSRN